MTSSLDPPWPTSLAALLGTRCLRTAQCHPGQVKDLRCKIQARRINKIITKITTKTTITIKNNRNSHDANYKKVKTYNNDNCLSKKCNFPNKRDPNIDPNIP